MRSNVHTPSRNRARSSCFHPEPLLSTCSKATPIGAISFVRSSVLCPNENETPPASANRSAEKAIARRRRATRHRADLGLGGHVGAEHEIVACALDRTGSAHRCGRGNHCVQRDQEPTRLNSGGGDDERRRQIETAA